jgi:FkbM family methyltransferase
MLERFLARPHALVARLGVDRAGIDELSTSGPWKAFKHLAQATHRIAASSSRFSSLYLRLFRLAKYLPDAAWKQHLLSSLQSVDWPAAEFAPAQVELHPSVSVHLVPHFREFDFAAHIYRRLDYEREVMSWLNGRVYDVIIEIGANVGIYTLLFARLWPRSRIFCFEPSRAAYLRLLENLSLNKCSNVFPFNCAVAGQTGFVDFYEPDGHLTNGSLDRSFAGLFSDSIASNKVFAIGGAEIAELAAPGKKVLLKIDVEGAEPIVVRSLELFIKVHAPDIVIEVLAPTIDELNRIDTLSNYRFYQLDYDGAIESPSFTAGRCRDYALVSR